VHPRMETVSPPLFTSTHHKQQQSSKTDECYAVLAVLVHYLKVRPKMLRRESGNRRDRFFLVLILAQVAFQQVKGFASPKASNTNCCVFHQRQHQRYERERTITNTRTRTPKRCYSKTADDCDDGIFNFAQEKDEVGRRSMLFQIISSSITALAAGPSPAQASAKSNTQISKQLALLEHVENNEMAGATATASATVTQIPLKFIKELQAYVAFYTVGGDKFGAIVDTGSPFLMIPHSYCDETTPSSKKWGCYVPSHSVPREDFPPTIEMFDNNSGEVEWRAAPFEFVSAKTYTIVPSPPPPSLNQSLTQSFVSLEATTTVPTAEAVLQRDGDGLRGSRQQQQQQGDMVFGVLSESLMNGSGGVFLGLIRDTDLRIRPSFLGQTMPKIRSFAIDLRDNNNASFGDADTGTAQSKTLVLSTGRAQQSLLDLQSYINNGNHQYIRLVKDLNTKYGDPSSHYTARATSITVNGHELAQDRNGRSSKPIYVIFDTGVTGMVVSQDLYDERYAMARRNREKRLWQDVEITFSTTDLHKSRTSRSTTSSNRPRAAYASPYEVAEPKSICISADKPITTPVDDIPWKGFQDHAYLVVVGLSFFEGHKLTIDIDEQKLWID
jgi:hypothetical protein